MLIYLVRIPHYQSTPYNATCSGGRSHRINGVKRVASDRRDLNPHLGNVGSCNLAMRRRVEGIAIIAGGNLDGRGLIMEID